MTCQVGTEAKSSLDKALKQYAAARGKGRDQDMDAIAARFNIVLKTGDYLQRTYAVRAAASRACLKGNPFPGNIPNCTFEIIPWEFPLRSPFLFEFSCCAFSVCACAVVLSVAVPFAPVRFTPFCCCAVCACAIRTCAVCACAVGFCLFFCALTVACPAARGTVPSTHHTRAHSYTRMDAHVYTHTLVPRTGTHAGGYDCKHVRVGERAVRV